MYKSSRDFQEIPYKKTKQSTMESYLENLKTRAKCSLCHDRLVDPRLVNCFHAFCKMCLKMQYGLHANEDNCELVNRQDFIFICPQCKSATLLQHLNDVDDLQFSPVHARILNVLELVENHKICSVSSSHPEALWHCFDCEKSLCEECFRNHSKPTTIHQVVLVSDLRKEDIDILLQKEPVCKTRHHQTMEFYCQDSNSLFMHDVIATQKDTLSTTLEQIDKLSTDKKEKKQQEEIALIIKRDGEKAKQQVVEFTEKLVKTLRNNEQQLLNKIQENITRAGWNLRTISHTTQAQEYIKYFVENCTAGKMSNTRNDESSQNIIYDPFDKNVGGIEFKPGQELEEQGKHGLGMLTTFNKSNSKMGTIKVLPSDLEATKKAKLVVEMKASEGEITQEPLENVAIQFIPEDNVTTGEIQLTDSSGFIVSFTPHVAGQLTVDIKLHGNPVCSGSLSMCVKPQQITEKNGNSKLKDALNTGSKYFRGIAVNKTNTKIAVADYQLKCVRVFNRQGDLLLTYVNKDRKQHQLSGPEGLAFLNETDLVISDGLNHRICIVDTTSGKLVKSFGCHGNGNGQFKYPCGVHVDDGENIIVCDMWNSRVQVFTKHGHYLYQFSVPGYPCGVVKRDGLFYVSSNKMVYVIEMKGKKSPTRVTTIGDKDYTNGQLQCPYGLAIDNDNNLYVCDHGVCLIHKFTLAGRHVGQSSRLAKSPCYIAVLNDGKVICTTCKGVVFFNNCEQIAVLALDMHSKIENNVEEFEACGLFES